MSSLDWIANDLKQLAQADLLRQRTSRSGKMEAQIVVDGKRYINFGSNDYLGIAADPALHEVIQRTVLRGGWGSGASPLIVGRSALHAELERRLATFLQRESALLFPTGFAANMGTIPAIVGKSDIIFSDAKNHASIIDGCRLSGAKVVIYPHADANSLNELVRQQNFDQFRRKLIVTDGLFSMDGDRAPVRQLAEIAEANDAMLMVDEAHSLGVLGTGGRGVSIDHELGDDKLANRELANKVHLVVGTLSKSFGSHGGFVAGSRELIEFLANRARSYVFSTASPAATAATALEALNIMRDQPERRERLLKTARHVHRELTNQGWSVGPEPSHIMPVMVGKASQAIEMATMLGDAGLWVPCIRPPSVPDGESLLRISLSAAHTSTMVSMLLDAFQQARR